MLWTLKLCVTFFYLRLTVRMRSIHISVELKLTHDAAWPWDLPEAYIRRHGPDNNFVACPDVDHLLLVQALQELLADTS